MNDDEGLFIGGDPFDDPLWQGATKPVRRAKRVQDGSLIGCRAAWLEQVLPHIKSKEQLVVALLLYRQHARYAGRAFTFANGEAAYFGIDRHTKYAALTNLEQGEVIKLGRRNGQALEITVLCDWRTGLP